ncbi:hypothetical protein MMC07_006915 [Pseudocyphellaria aurata]|nr:hypothetical protein [Pseudocyphellaria aurata]
MQSSYEVFLPSQPYLGPRPEPRGRSSSLLTSIKSLVRSSLSRSRSPRRIQVGIEGRPEREISQTTHDKRKAVPSSLKCLKPQVWPRRRRRHVPITSVADYLTLAQLETLWRQQDTSYGDAQIARQPQQQELGRPVSKGRIWQPLQPSDIHPAFRSSSNSSPDHANGPAICCTDPLAAARYM